MSNATKTQARPAQLGFLAIYNPSLGTTDETLEQQIVYYQTGDAPTRGRRARGERRDPKAISKEDMNKRLRQIGLAQGMVEFGRSFSNGDSVDSVETQKSRIVLHELEVGWWVLASIDLSQIPLASPPKSLNIKDTKEDAPKVEFSSREVKPYALLLQDIVRAHNTFLLHHASSMSELFVRYKRSKFMSILGRYWDSFLASWNVMLHGNPAVSIYGGIKLAACGELGIGVGEEDRGSGEREVLEGFVGRVEGLVDIVVSKFGDVSPELEAAQQPRAWLGSGADPSPADGAVFLGTGALSRKSLCAVTHWMEDIYTLGPQAYGVKVNPSAVRQPRTRPQKTTQTTQPSAGENRARSSSWIRGKLARSSSSPGSKTTSPVRTAGDEPDATARIPLRKRHSTAAGHDKGGKISNIFRLGYGTHWSLGSTPSKDRTSGSESEQQDKPTDSESGGSLDKTQPVAPPPKENPETPDVDDSLGHYLIGMMGDMDEKTNISAGESSGADSEEPGESNSRIPVRTVTVELEREGDTRSEPNLSIELGSADAKRFEPREGSDRQASHTSYESQDRNKTKRLRVLVYVNRPFMFTFLFDVGTDALAWEPLYRSLHYQLAPLLRPLLASTQYKLTKPVLDAAGLENTKAPIYDLIWDPQLLTVYSTLPNIPDPFQTGQKDNELPAWSRLEALNTHIQILNTHANTRSGVTEFERTCKTSRGWWIVWARIPATPPPSGPPSRRSGEVTPQAVPLPMTRPEGSQESQYSNKTTETGRDTGQKTGTTMTSLLSGPAHPFLEHRKSDEKLPKDKEVFLIRRSSEYITAVASTRFGTSLLGDSGWGADAAKLAQGIGVDTKRYIEGLLNLS